MYSLIPFWYLGGLLALIALFGAMALLSKGNRQYYFSWFFRASLTYTALFWLVVALTTDVQRDYLLESTWQHAPGSQSNAANLVTFAYRDYPGCYERVNSPEIYKYLASRNGQSVTLTLRVSYDFGRVRGYGLEKVDDQPVNQSWVAGNPPWQLFAQRSSASRWLKIFGTTIFNLFSLEKK